MAALEGLFFLFCFFFKKKSYFENVEFRKEKLGTQKTTHFKLVSQEVCLVKLLFKISQQLVISSQTTFAACVMMARFQRVAGALCVLCVVCCVRNQNSVQETYENIKIYFYLGAIENITFLGDSLFELSQLCEMNNELFILKKK